MNVEVLGDDVCYDGFLPGLMKKSVTVGGKVQYAQMASRNGWVAAMMPHIPAPSIPYGVAAMPVSRARTTLTIEEVAERRRVAKQKADRLAQLKAMAFLGEDNWLVSLGKSVLGDTVKAVVPEIVKRITPTQKAVIQQITGTTSSVTYPPQDPMKANMPYIIIGGALIVGAIVMLKTRRSRR